MAFGLFGSASENKTTNTTNATDASATAAEGAIAASGSSRITVNSVDPEIARQAFGFGETALGSNVLIAGQALDSGLESLRINAGLVPGLLDAQGKQTSEVLRAAQEQTNLAEQFASIGAGLARGAQTGGASTLLEGPAPYLMAAVILGGLYFAMKRK